MLSRRIILAAAASISIVSPFRRAKAVNNPAIGAIRWDAWYSEGSPGNTYQRNLYPTQFQYRAPWFFNTYSGSIDGNGDRQLIMDLEIQYAAAAGLTFWAFDQYDLALNPFTNNMMNAWKFYQQSPFNSQINWCMLAVSDSLFGTTGNFSSQVAQYVTWFQQSNYQKVLGNRPLLFLFGFNSFPSFGGNSANFATMVSALRTSCINAGLGSPYIVWMDGSPTTAFNISQQIGGDAISNYAYFATSQGQSYASLSDGVIASWAAMMNTGSPIIPNVQMGADTRPRNGAHWAIPGTPSERAAQLLSARSFAQANPTSCPANTIIIYSWTECDEGGGALIPTVGDPPTGPPPSGLNSILSAIASVL